MWAHDFKRITRFGKYVGSVVLACPACQSTLQAQLALEALETL
jgi:hypothetical protein